jgi:hypothetical protein
MRLQMSKKILLLLIILIIPCLSPAPIHTWEFINESLQPAAVPATSQRVSTPVRSDFDGDGIMETLALRDGRASIRSNDQLRWQSPREWKVRQAWLGDLNHDGSIEAVLLVWRPFKPWPVDRWLPSGGRISQFHDAQGESCHFMLIGWSRGMFRERWAGSALAEPVKTFALADLNQDGKSELITLDTTYAAPADNPANALKVWEWNGFGFSLVSRIKGSFNSLMVVRTQDGRVLILAP